MTERLLSFAEVANRLGVSDRQVRRFIAEARDPLPCIVLGRRCRKVSPVELEAWTARRRVTSPAPQPGLFAGFSDSARAALEELFCAQTAPGAPQVRDDAHMTR